MRAPLRIGVQSSVASALVIVVFLTIGGYKPVDLLFPGAYSRGSQVVERDFGSEAVPTRFGYDGQEMYVIAATFPDLAQASHDGIYEFRMRRPVQPGLASLLPPGSPTVLGMTALCILGIGLASGGLADLAERHRRDPRAGYAATVALAFPLIITTTEPLAFGLGLLGLALVDRRRWVLGAVAFAVAGLSRETALVMAVAAAIALWRAAGVRQAVGLLAVAFAPFITWSIWVRSQVPADTYKSVQLFGFLDLPPLSALDIALAFATLGLMIAGVLLWRDVPSLALTCLGYLGCCALYIGDSFQFEGFVRVCAAGIAIGLAGVFARPQPSAITGPASADVA